MINKPSLNAFCAVVLCLGLAFPAGPASALRPLTPPEGGVAADISDRFSAGAEETFAARLKEKVAAAKTRAGAPWVDLSGDDDALFLRLGVRTGEIVEIALNSGSVLALSRAGERLSHIAPPPDPERPERLLPLPQEKKELWLDWVDRIQQAGGIHSMLVLTDSPSDPSQVSVSGRFSMRMASGDRWLVIRIDDEGRWTGEWQFSYPSRVPPADQLQEVPIDAVLPPPLRGGTAPRFFVLDAPVRIPQSFLRNNPVRLLPGSSFDGVIEISLPASGKPRVRAHTQTELQARSLTNERIGMQVEPVPAEEGGGVLIRPLSPQLRLEYLPPELQLTMEQLGYTAWIVSWVHRTMAPHYQSEEQLLSDAHVRELASIPAFQEKGLPPAVVRISRTPFTAARKAKLDVRFPSGAWSREGLAAIGGTPGKPGEWKPLLAQVSGGFPSLKVLYRVLADGGLHLQTEEQKVAELLDSLRVAARLSAVLMEKEPSAVKYEDMVDPARFSTHGLSKLALEPGAPESQRDYLQKYLAIAALADRPGIDGIAVLSRLLNVKVEESQRMLPPREPGELERVLFSRVVTRVEPHGPFRLAALAHIDRRMETQPVKQDEREYLLQIMLGHYTALLTGETKDPLTSVRWAAQQGMARLVPPGTPGVYINLVLNVMREVRDDWDETPALRVRAGELVELLKKQREQNLPGLPGQLRLGGVGVPMALGFSLELERDWLSEEAHFVQPKSHPAKVFFRSAMKFLRSGDSQSRPEQGYALFESRLQREDEKEVVILGLEEEGFQLLRGPIRFRSEEDAHPYASLVIHIGQAREREVERRIDRIFPDAASLVEGEDGLDRELSYGITSIGRAGALRLIPFRSEDGRLGFRTEPEPVSQLGDDVPLLVALAAEILPGLSEEDEEEGMDPVYAGAEEPLRVTEFDGSSEFARSAFGINENQRVLVIRPPAVRLPQTAALLAHADIIGYLQRKVPGSFELFPLMFPSLRMESSVAQQSARKAVASFSNAGVPLTVLLHRKHVNPGEERLWLPPESEGIAVLNLTEVAIADPAMTAERLELLRVLALRLGGVLVVSAVDFEGRFEDEQAIIVYL